jgi:tetratricopeptide (TPR) repeat protein
MMKQKTYSLSLWLSVAASAALLPAVQAIAQSAPAAPAAAPAPIAATKVPVPAPEAAVAPAPDRAVAYYHYALGALYEDDAATLGRPEYVSRAIEEYKLALNADPASAQVNNALSDIYFRAGRVHEAELAARETIKNSPDDLEAHKQLGRIYLRQLSEGQSATGAPANVLDLAIAEYLKIVALTPKSVEDRMVLGQLYTVKHDAAKAEEQFKTAQAIEPDSETVVLNMARLYAESGDVAHAAKVIEAVPVSDRSPKMEFALGAAYDQLKQPKDAIAAYQRASDMDPGDAHTIAALAEALLNNNQLDEALKQYKQLAESDPDDVPTLIHIGEIQRRQSKFEDALATFRTAREKNTDSHGTGVTLEIGYNEGMLLDALGRFDEAVDTYQKMVDLTSHANGAYTTEEKNNRAIFLERLAALYHEQNNLEQAVATYQKLIDMGGEQAAGGYRGLIECYNDARNFDRAVEITRKAVEANPKDRDLKEILADELVSQGKADEAVALAKGLVDSSKDDRATLLSLGHLYVRLRRWKDAEDTYAKVATLTTKKEDSASLLYFRGELAERQKHYDQAEQIFHQALDIDPNSVSTLNYLGYMLADKGMRLPEALKLIRKAVELDPTNGAILDSLGWVYFKLGQYELAEENLLHAVERDRTDPTLHDHLGDLYEKTGRIRLAAAQWELSLAGFAKSAQVDLEPGEVAKVQRKLDSARVKLAKQENAIGEPRP